MVLLALFDVVDDTVAVKKLLLSELKPELQDVITNTFGRKVSLSLCVCVCVFVCVFVFVCFS
jgi:hypothetical protein